MGPAGLGWRRMKARQSKLSHTHRHVGGQEERAGLPAPWPYGLGGGLFSWASKRDGSEEERHGCHGAALSSGQSWKLQSSPEQNQVLNDLTNAFENQVDLLVLESVTS